jgi:hypothetical protein
MPGRHSGEDRSEFLKLSLLADLQAHSSGTSGVGD